MQRVAAVAGLEVIAARHGITPAQARTCLSTQAGLDRLIQMQQAGTRYGVTGTPAFAVNGRIAGSVYDWATLEPLLRGR
jgi:protein-disulfide isomerase